MWAARHPYGKVAHNGNVFFRDDVLYSFSLHFAVARFVDRRGRTMVLFNSRRRSVMTSWHQRLAQSAVPRYVPRARVDNLWANTSAHHRHNLLGFRAQLVRLARRVVLSRCEFHRQQKLDDLVEAVVEANAYLTFYGLRQRFDVKSQLEKVKKMLFLRRRALARTRWYKVRQARRAERAAARQVEKQIAVSRRAERAHRAWQRSRGRRGRRRTVRKTLPEGPCGQGDNREHPDRAGGRSVLGRCGPVWAPGWIGGRWRPCSFWSSRRRPGLLDTG